jgi:hypothetical protein
MLICTHSSFNHTWILNLTMCYTGGKKLSLKSTNLDDTKMNTDIGRWQASPLMMYSRKLSQPDLESTSSANVLCEIPKRAAAFPCFRCLQNSDSPMSIFGDDSQRHNWGLNAVPSTGHTSYSAFAVFRIFFQAVWKIFACSNGITTALL